MILIINGFGGSTEYMRDFATPLKPVMIVSLLHGVSLAQECSRINAIIERDSPTAIIAFSTGCIVACSCDLPTGCRLHGALVNEPRPDELARIVFARSITDLLTTLQTCLLEPGVKPMIDVVKSGRCRVDVLVGETDPYRHVAHALCDAGVSVKLHRIAGGDHHMLYHMPSECAERVKIILGGW
ncbi:MAG: hypothetical protein EB060_12555 [Proteobacteria bacterium]|nr:hypothetical protein [Pseudomonadota bacterium]